MAGVTWADLARSVREARRWDPEGKVPDVEPFGGIASADPAQREASFSRLAFLGSTLAGPAVRRILDAAAPSDRAAYLRSLGAGPGRDRCWAKEAIRALRHPHRDVRAAAAGILMAQAGREQIGDMKVALELETERSIRSSIWYALITTSGAPEHLPALPVDSEEYSTVLGLMASGPTSEMRAAAWSAVANRRPAALPGLFWEEPARLQSLIGTASYITEMPSGYSPRAMTLDIRSLLADSARPQARSSAAINDDFSPVEIARVSTFLFDPDQNVRRCAQAALERWDRSNQQISESERREALARLGAAARTLLDSAVGAGDPSSAGWATKALLAAGRSSSSAATIAYQAIWIAREAAGESLLTLEEDKELGPAAKRVRRLLAFGISPQSVGFGSGLDGAPRVRSGSLQGIDLDAWRALSLSEDGEEKQLAVALLGDAWDRLDMRGEVVADIRRLAESQDSATNLAAIAFLAGQAPEQLPPREEVDYRDVWSRPRSYVISRLRLALAPAGILDRQKTSLFLSHGDRSLLLSAVRAGRFDQPTTEMALTMQGGEVGLLPILISRLADLEAPPNAQWFGALASCSPQGARVVAAVARDADRKIRPFALASLLSRPWADPLAEPIAEALASSENADERKVLLEALRASPGRNRLPCSPRLADSIAALLLRLAPEPGSRADIESLISTLGESLSRATPGSLAALAKEPTISAIARNYGIDYSILPPVEMQVLSGDRNSRYRALSRLPWRSLKSIRLATLSWLTCGNLNDSSETWMLQRSGELADLVLLAWAVDDPESRDELIRLRRLVRRWYYSPPPPAPVSLRLLEAEPPPEFDGNSMLRRRISTAQATSKDPSPSFFSLCTAAFRGSPGDEVALQAVIPRLGPDAIPRLIPLLNATTPGIRQVAARSLGRLGAIAPLFAAAALRASLEGETHRAARSSKLAALVRLKDPSGLEALRPMASSADADDRLTALRALEQAPGAEVATILATLAGDDDFPVREAAHSALQRMTRREYPPDNAPWATRDWKAWMAANPGAEFRFGENE
ncbi:MAG: hypothetical protein FD180_2063 [Planctomycetota bacterium]|nr:MAG: hypothetical protein FD180_2063 [Planctomycetota bacterium]